MRSCLKPTCVSLILFLFNWPFKRVYSTWNGSVISSTFPNWFSLFINQIRVLLIALNRYHTQPGMEAVKPSYPKLEVRTSLIGAQFLFSFWLAILKIYDRVTTVSRYPSFIHHPTTILCDHFKISDTDEADNQCSEYTNSTWGGSILAQHFKHHQTHLHFSHSNLITHIGIAITHKWMTDWSRRDD